MSINIRRIKKLKKRKTFSVNLVIVVFLICIISISYGYALWSSQLEAKGTITAMESEAQTPITIVPESGTDQYIVTDFSSTNAVISEQYIEGNKLVVNYSLRSSTGQGRNTTINLKIKNNREEIMTNGTGTYEISGSKTFFTTNPKITVPETVEVGNTVDVVMNLNGLKFNKVGTLATCTFTISYLMGSTSVQFIVELNFS